ncbi:MAG TPA: shikimate kinase [Acidimicrobiales bacterium]|nr:shikimate kinase [Acidimicrobiales bacterium]
MADRILLVGMMGAGKSTVARLLAARLGWTWLDTDTELSRTARSSVADLFAQEGESRFRHQESRALQKVLGRDGPLVVSVGGGAVLDQANRAAIGAAGTVVWLRARPDTLLDRVSDGAGRPLLAGRRPEDRAHTLRALDRQRRPLYAEVADQIIDVDGLDAPTVTDRLLDAVGLDAPGRGVHP